MELKHTHEHDQSSLFANTNLELAVQVIKAAKSDSRLANNNLPPEIQKLRCRVHYDSLRFAPHIEALGKVYIQNSIQFNFLQSIFAI